MRKYISQRPIVIVANSSFYIYHYRKLLIKYLSKKNHIITIAPTDSSTSKLCKISVHLPWRIQRNRDLNPVALIISFIRLVFLIRAIKPKLIHSHTLKSNLIVSIISSIYSIPSVLSFTGLGRLSKSKNKYFLFKYTIKSIIYFSLRQRNKLFTLDKNISRSRFIFQNPEDKKVIESIDNSISNISKIVYGSGLPKHYLDKKLIPNNNWNKHNSNEIIPKVQFIFCARLLISKGINTFIKLADFFPEHEFIIYGQRDFSSKESISQESLNSLTEKNNIFLKGYKKYPLMNKKNSYPVLIVPSFYGEGFPRAILEAFSLEIPVISSKTATCNLFKNENLYISEDTSIISYKKNIESLFKDYKNGNLSKKISASKELALFYTEEKIVKRTVSIYKELLKENTIPEILKKDIDNLSLNLPK